MDENTTTKKAFDKIQNLKDVEDIEKDIRKIEVALNSPGCANKEAIVNEIYKAYPWMNLEISLLPTTSLKTYNQMTEIDYQYVLNKQYELLKLYETGKMNEFFDI